MPVHMTWYFVKFIKRRLRILSVILVSLSLILILQNRNHRKEIRSFDEVKTLLDQLFDPLTSFEDVQSIWNELIQIWKEILLKFLRDAHRLCHSDRSSSLNLTEYIHQINQSFYPWNESQRPDGMGMNYYFDLKTFHSLNNSILSTDVTLCDYFHMIELMMRVQLILHRANIRYFLTKGTLLGTLRHHDLIPWDTDMDFFIPETSVNSLRKVFERLNEEDLLISRFRNIYGLISYKIFARSSPIVNGTNYRWPKIDLFPYRENSTHIYAAPTHLHNLGTMSSINKTNIEPIYLRLLGPILVPSPYHPRRSLKAMIRLGRSNLFHVCEGNAFSHRHNEKTIEPWRLPCQELQQSYSFVRSHYNSSTGLCSEQLISSQRNQSLSYYVYKCHEDLPRTIIV